MNSGSLAPLSANEEVTLRRVALGMQHGGESFRIGYQAVESVVPDRGA